MHVQARGGVDRQPLAARAGQCRGELGVGIGWFPVGQVDLTGAGVGFWGDDGVQPGVLLGAGELHVQPVGVLLAGDAHQRPPPGQPLGLVPGGRIGQVHHPPPWRDRAVQVAGWEGDLAALLGPQRQRAVLHVQAGDGPAGAVGHPQPAQVVAATHHLIAHMHLAVADLDRLGAQATVVGHDLLAGGVEPVDLVAAVGQDHRLPSRLPRPLGGLGVLVGLPPVPHKVQGQLGLGGRRHHPLVLAIGGDGLVDLAVADQLQRLPLPRGPLPPVLHQDAGPQAHPQSTEPAAGVDRGKLPVVADQHDLRAGLVGVLEEAGELAGADHAGLIHHQHRPCVQHRRLLEPGGERSMVGAGVLVELVQEPVDGGDLLEPLRLQAGRRDPRGCRAQHAVAVQREGVAGHTKRVGLAGAGLADHHPHPIR